MVHHHGREEDGAVSDEVRPSAFNGLLGGSLAARCSLGYKMRSQVEELIDLLVSGIREHVAELSPQGSGEGIAGYALIVDADILSVMGASASRGFVRERQNESSIFVPVDWPSESHSEFFGRASKRLASLSDVKVPYEIRVRDAVVCLATALHRARTAEPSLEEAILLAVCADGGGVWDEREGNVVRQLNGAAVYECWVRASGRAESL